MATSQGREEAYIAEARARGEAALRRRFESAEQAVAAYIQGNPDRAHTIAEQYDLATDPNWILAAVNHAVNTAVKRYRSGYMPPLSAKEDVLNQIILGSDLINLIAFRPVH